MIKNKLIRILQKLGGQQLPLSAPIVYAHKFAVLSKSYLRDIERSYNSYQSFEAFFTDKSAPFFIVVPECDLDSFKRLFTEGIHKNAIANMPIFMTERQVLESSGEPVAAALAMGGYYVQQIVKLSFGLTGLAQHYLILDPDGYFTREFDKSYLYKNGRLQFPFHECWHRYRLSGEMERLNEIGHGDARLAKFGITFFDASKIIKKAMGINSDCFRNYVASPNVFDSAIIREMKVRLQENGINNFSYAIHIAPFEFQWYGEYLDALGKLMPLPYLFHVVDPSRDTVYIKNDDNRTLGKYGIQYQSFDYENNRTNPRIRPKVVYQPLG